MTRLSILILAAMVAGGCAEDPYPESVRSLNEYNEAWDRRNFERAIALVKRANDQTFQAIDEAKRWRALAESRPTVVTITKYVDRVVTQECQRAHRDEPRNKWFGDGKIVTNNVGVEK